MKFLLKSIRGLERVSWTIIGTIVGILCAILLSLFAQVEVAASITAGLAVTIVSIQIGEIAQRDHVAEILGPYYELRKDRIFYNQVQQIVDNYMTVQAFNSETFAAKSTQLLDVLVDELSLLADGRLHITTHEDLLFTIEQQSNCKSDLKAASWQDKIEYWDSPEGKNYVEAHRTFIEHAKGRITRVFILSRDELQEYKRIMLSQSKMGIDVRIAFVETLPADCLEGFVIYDNSTLRVERLVSGFHKSSILSIDQNEVRNYNRKFDGLFLRSVPISEVFDECDETTRV
jgi:uncharacterized membrane protein